MAKRKFPKTTDGAKPAFFFKKKSKLPELVWSVNVIGSVESLQTHLNGIAAAYGAVHFIGACPWKPECVLVCSYVNINKAELIAKAIADKAGPAPELPEAS